MDFDEIWQETSPKHTLSSLCFSCWSVIQDGRPDLSLVESFFDFFTVTAEWILTKLDRKQVLNVLYQVRVFLLRSEIQDGRLGLWLAGIFFEFFTSTAEYILKILDKKRVLNVFYRVLSAPEPKAQVHYWDHGLSVLRRYYGLAVLRRSWLKFHIFHFFFQTAERKLTKPDRRQVLNALYKVFCANLKSKIATLSSD